MQVPIDTVQEPQVDATKGRCLRRTVSVPSEGQFPEYPAEGAAKLGKWKPWPQQIEFNF